MIRRMTIGRDMCQWNKSHGTSACIRSNTAKQTIVRLSSADIQNRIEADDNDLGIHDSSIHMTRSTPEPVRERAWATLGRVMDSTERVVSVSKDTYFASPTSHGSTWYAPTKRSTRIHTIHTNVPPPVMSVANLAQLTKWSEWISVT